ncbi:MAG: hypothetical protein CMJ64_02750 [Planctomycetaceae bacterium]|nr:hypothetical protein [Planctomycetaceae bacterium]
MPDGSALSTTLTGSPAPGTYQFTPVRQAQAHQLLSGGFASRDTALGGARFRSVSAASASANWARWI